MVIRLILVILVVYLKFAKFFILCGNFLVSFTSFFYKIIYPQEGLIAKFSRNYWREHHFKYKIRKKWTASWWTGQGSLWTCHFMLICFMCLQCLHFIKLGFDCLNIFLAIIFTWNLIQCRPNSYFII